MKSRPATAASTDQAPPAALAWGLSSGQAAILAAILLAAIAVYLPSLRNDWLFDDWYKFVDNKYLHHWSFIWKSFTHDSWWFRNPARLPQGQYYRPVENAFIAACALLFGTHLAAWHLVKIVLHLITVVLCFRIAQLLSRNTAVALLSAAIFGVMPAHVDPVVWVSAMSEPLSTAFELGALLCLIGRKPGWSRGMISALALYACAQLTHESAFAFSLIVAAYVFLIEGAADKQPPRSSPNPAAIRTRAAAAARVAAPFALIALAYLCLRVIVLGYPFGRPSEPAAASVRNLQRHHGFGPVSYMMTLPVVLLTDLGVMALPGIAGPAHAVVWIERVSPITFVSAGVLLILAAGAWLLVRPSPDRRLYLFCAAWTGLTLAPSMSLHSIWSLVQDRYLYAPSFGWSLALALAAVRIAAVSPRARAAVGTAMALLLAGYMVMATRIEPYWHDDVTFFKQCVASDPERNEYRRRLAEALDKRHDFAAAARVLEGGVALDPYDPNFHLRLTQEYMKMGRVADFEREFQTYNDLVGGPIPPRSAAQSQSPPQPAAAP